MPTGCVEGHAGCSANLFGGRCSCSDGVICGVHLVVVWAGIAHWNSSPAIVGAWPSCMRFVSMGSSAEELELLKRSRMSALSAGPGSGSAFHFTLPADARGVRAAKHLAEHRFSVASRTSTHLSELARVANSAGSTPWGRQFARSSRARDFLTPSLRNSALAMAMA